MRVKSTSLLNIHKQLGAKIVPFAGYNMPLEYSGVNKEHLNVRNNLGLFDVSHMGEIWVKGPKAYEFLQRLTSNDISRLNPGKAQYNCLPNGKGGIVDDLIVYRYEQEKYLLVVNASNTSKDWEWLNKQNSVGAELENASDKISLLAVQGPKATQALQKITNVDLSQLLFYTFKEGEIGGVPNVIISATGYTGSGGYELYFYNQYAEKLWKAIMDAGEEFDISPVGLGARDTLRLEMGFCLYGNDIDESTSPIEAGLGWITKFNDDNNFIDKELLIKQKNEGVTRKLVGFEMIDRGIPRQHYTVYNTSKEKIGEVTSGTMSPMIKIGIGMGYVNSNYSLPGTEIYIGVRNKMLKAKVVKMPFYRT